MSAPAELLTSAEARAYLKVSRSTLDRACEEWRRTKGRRGLPHLQRSAKAHRKFRLADLDRFAAGDTPTTRLRAAA